MQRLDATKPADAQDLFESIRETRAAINAVMDENDVLIERLAKLEGENDALKSRHDTTDKALMKNIQNLALHTHSELGQASIPLAS